MEKNMTKTFRSISEQTRNNWLIDAAVFIGAITASLSGIYFLFLPQGGYQGGRNPMYGATFLFSRSTWDDLHTWGGILMIITAVVHIANHWKWILSMIRRVGKDLTGTVSLNNRSRFNVAINATIGVSFVVVAITGVYLLFVTGGKRGFPDPMFLFSRTTWDLIHTWAGILMIIAGVVHFAIHWKWVVKVTAKVFKSIPPASLEVRKSY
jgi:hypothetical protein